MCAGRSFGDYRHGNASQYGANDQQRLIDSGRGALYEVKPDASIPDDDTELLRDYVKEVIEASSSVKLIFSTAVIKLSRPRLIVALFYFLMYLVHGEIKVKQNTIALALLPLLFTCDKSPDTRNACSGKPGSSGRYYCTGGARRITGDQTAALRDSLSDKPAKNIILLIGDGMGTRKLLPHAIMPKVRAAFKGIDALPLTGQYTHYALNKKPANRTTSPTRLHQQPLWSTGVKTYNGALGVDIHERSPNDSGNGKAAGLATGNVSTAELQDATPAALVAHVTSRKCYGPSATSEKMSG